MLGRFPASLLDPRYFYAALAGYLLAVAAFPVFKTTPSFLFILKLFDALGLAIFSVLGAQVALQHNLNLLSTVLLGLLTGIGGGVLRDVLANEVPLVLRQEVYALASLIGVMTLWFAYHAGISVTVAVILGAIVVFVIRLAAIYWHLNLPRVSRH
ncbi:MAG TPA: TRIC cation channel family protein, partial [Armatimonadota bacterium]